MEPSPWSELVGQPRAEAQLRAAAEAPVHAYLLVGPRGSGKRAAARAFAAAVLSASDEHRDAERDIRLALAERHPDLVVIEPEGALFRGGRGRPETETARFLREAMSSPTEGARKVVVADAFHTANDEAVGRMLKVIEEPPASTIVVLLADEVVPEQATIASRCVTIELGRIAPAQIAAELERSGVDPARAADAAASSGGDLGRARLLAVDPQLDARRRAWWSLPEELDGTGAAVARAVAVAQANLDAAETPLDERQAAEDEELQARIEQYGERGSGRKVVEDAHRRERRRIRTDELLFGLSILAGRYRDALLTAHDTGPVVRSLDALQRVGEALERNPNETLLLQALLLDLAPLAPEAAVTSSDRSPAAR